ncbi:hypothetical protein B0H11DRAFT_1939374, partial [Mycena galericulata]
MNLTAATPSISIHNLMTLPVRYGRGVLQLPLAGEEYGSLGPSTRRQRVSGSGLQSGRFWESNGIVEQVWEGRYYKGAALALRAQANAPNRRTTTRTAVRTRTGSRRGRPAGTGVDEGAEEHGRARAPRLHRPRVPAQQPLVPGRLRGAPPRQGRQRGLRRRGWGEHTKTASGGGRVLPPDPASHALHCLLQELPDFVHMLRLKGAFLYVALQSRASSAARLQMCVLRGTSSQVLAFSRTRILVEGGVSCPLAPLGDEDEDEVRDGRVAVCRSAHSSALPTAAAHATPEADSPRRRACGFGTCVERSENQNGHASITGSRFAERDWPRAFSGVDIKCGSRTA